MVSFVIIPGPDDVWHVRLGQPAVILDTFTLKRDPQALYTDVRAMAVGRMSQLLGSSNIQQ